MADGGARRLEGAPIADEIRTAVAEDVASFTTANGRPPVLAVVIVGRDAPSTVYLERILKGCAKVGIEAAFVELEGEATEAAVVDTIRTLNADPATAHAAVEILRRSGVEIAGRDAVVIGRSAVVGMPAAFLLVREDATVTVCHSRTRDLATHVARADIVVVAAGHPGLITGAMLKPGAVVVDVGINLVEGKIVGDVDFESASRVASAITPVPGGVGPLTNALLLTHLIRAAERQADARRDTTRPPVTAAASSRGDR